MTRRRKRLLPVVKLGEEHFRRALRAEEDSMREEGGSGSPLPPDRLSLLPLDRLPMSAAHGIRSWDEEDAIPPSPNNNTNTNSQSHRRRQHCNWNRDKWQVSSLLQTYKHYIKYWSCFLIIITTLEWGLYRWLHSHPHTTYGKRHSHNNDPHQQLQQPILRAYLEPPWTLDTSSSSSTLPVRNTSRAVLTQLEFPQATVSCHSFPASFPTNQERIFDDPFLPWIHDVFPNGQGTMLHFVAQNRRRCHTGKDHIDEMARLEAQIALFQPIPVKQMGHHDMHDIENDNDDDAFGDQSNDDRPVMKHHNREPKYVLSDLESADERETRFICYFHQGNRNDGISTLSVYPFNYEFVAWRKGQKGMFVSKGPDMSQFWLSQLLFQCPIPKEFQNKVSLGRQQQQQQQQQMPRLFVDLIPIRTPVRRPGEWLFHYNHTGKQSDGTFQPRKAWGQNTHTLPPMRDSGRWENIPICPRQQQSPSDDPTTTTTTTTTTKIDKPVVAKEKEKKKKHRLVACTWTSAAHQRRGNARTISDGIPRLREWIAFHLMVGFDHVYVYDNTAHFPNSTNLKMVTSLFPVSMVTHVEWPAQVCNNNRPMHSDPGERSSQYAAESSCRERFGPDTDWMASMDPDEYLIPSSQSTWHNMLDKADSQGLKVMKFRSTRARPRESLMDPFLTKSTTKDDVCKVIDKNNPPCLVPKGTETFLKVYNCDYIKSPKPSRFQRAMKQIYRPDHVLSHFVHYSTVTQPIARTWEETTRTQLHWSAHHYDDTITERFMDEFTEGVLLHAKTTTPDEMVGRFESCEANSFGMCPIGHECPDDVPFNDETHTKQLTTTHKGKFCNCWVNREVENNFVPRLEKALQRLPNLGELQ